jgi:Ca2+-transporting ATPase
MSMKQWWHLEIEDAAKFLDSDLSSGLTSQEAQGRLNKYGPNQLKEAKKYSALSIFFGQFEDFIIWVLIVAAVVSGFLKEWVDALAIIAIVILNAILGFIQEYRAEKSLAALKKMSSPTSKVIRGGRREVIASAQLVPGDIIELEAGDNVPADGRVAWMTSNFGVQEASLTGESTPVMKTTLALEERDIPLADRANMVYMGTSVSSGKTRAVVTETGMETELGKIAGMIQEIERESTPLQKKLEQFGKWIVYLCFVLVGMVFLLGWLRGGKIIDVFLTSVSLAVAAIPEGLPAVVTIALALGVQRMVKRHALIRKLPSVETLGCATVICSDKTGTLTKNEMTVQAIFAGGQLFKITGIGYAPKGEFLLDGKVVTTGGYPQLYKALSAGVLCNGAELIKDKDGYRIIGDPTEAAILTAAGKAGIWKEKQEQEFPFVEEIPFDPDRKKMTIIRQHNDKLIAFVKGAPDVLLEDCANIEIKGGIRTLTKEDKESILEVNNDLAGQAMRVLAVACRVLDGDTQVYQPGLIETKLTFVGLIAMIDPPREEVKRAIQECTRAGIKTVMITGDHKNTAVAIARQLGFFREDSLALGGEEIDRLSEDEFKKKVEKIPVYARVSPEHKLRIVRAWRARNQIVAMTGDGVNDAPAVKEADIGVAMGITGTDVTKEVSDMVITDDNFASIVAAVEEGRGVYDNIRKFVHYLLSCNAGEIMVMFVSSLAGWPAPLIPVQILWVNLVTDGLPALALGVEPVDPDVMERPPRPPNEHVVTKRRAFLMLAQGSFIAMCSLLAFTLVLFVENEGIGRARTAAFIVLSCSQLFHSFNCRNFTESLFKIGVFTNKKLILATGISFLLQMAVVYVPFLQRVFKTEALGLFDWLLVIIISSFPLWAMEVFKKVRKGIRAQGNRISGKRGNRGLGD